MATINPFQEPIDYSIDVKTPFEASLAGFKLGAEQATIRDAQQKRLLDQQAAQQAQARQAELGTRLKSFYDKKPEERNFEEIEQLFAFAGNKEQLDALKLMAEGTDKRRLDADKRFYAQVMLGLESEPTAAYKLLDDKILAEKDPGQKAALETIKRTAQTVNPAAAVNLIEPYTASIFGKDWYAGLKEARGERRLREEGKLKTDEGFTLLPESERERLDLPPGTYQIGPKGEYKLLAATKEQYRRLTAEEVKKEGLSPGSYQISPTGKIEPVGKEPLVSVSVGDQSKRDTLALKELDVPRAQEFSASAASARTLARDARVIANLLKGKGGGAAIKLGADVAKTFGFSTDTVVANDLANALAIRGATQIRPPGSGSTSDIEFRAFVSAFPSLANSEGGRELMAKYADAFAKRTAKIADHARKLIRSDTYSEEEIARFDESLGAVLDKDFYESVNTGPRANVPRYAPPATAPAPASAPSATPRTVDSVLQQYLPKNQSR
jgi:hypothetical protein